jgi:hypothetical protein
MYFQNHTIRHEPDSGQDGGTAPANGAAHTFAAGSNPPGPQL